MRARLSPLRRLIAAGTAVVAVVVFAGGLAGAQQDAIDDLRQQREDNRRAAAEVAAELDALAAEDEALQEAIDALDAHIRLQESKVVAAEDAIADAERRARLAIEEANALDGEMEAIRDRLRVAVVDAFVAPRTDPIMELDSENLLDAELKQSYIDEVVGDEFELLDGLRVAQSRQNAARQRAEDARAEAAAERAELDAKLAELDDDRAEVERLRGEVSVRVADWESVGSEIDAADAAMQIQIRELEEDLARQIAEAEARRLAEEEEARRIAEEEAAAAEEEAAADEDDADDSDEGDGDEADDGTDDEQPPVVLGPFAVTHRPVPGAVTSPFGPRVHPIFGTTRNHYGLDFNGSMGQPISVAATGVVLSAGWMNGYGNTVVVSHGDGFTTLYAHMSQTNVSSGASVSGGDVIGLVGSTGWSTGPHLHWEIRVDGVAVDPAPYL
ncbi:MAG: M23 family metallopeptidase [Actinomycetota bacterium]